MYYEFLRCPWTALQSGQGRIAPGSHHTHCKAVQQNAPVHVWKCCTLSSCPRNRQKVPLPQQIHRQEEQQSPHPVLECAVQLPPLSPASRQITTDRQIGCVASARTEVRTCCTFLCCPCGGGAAICYHGHTQSCPRSPQIHRQAAQKLRHPMLGCAARSPVAPEDRRCNCRRQNGVSCPFTSLLLPPSFA